MTCFASCRKPSGAIFSCGGQSESTRRARSTYLESPGGAGRRWAKAISRPVRSIFAPFGGEHTQSSGTPLPREECSMDASMRAPAQEARADGATPVQWLSGIIIPSAEQVLANPTFFDAGAPQCNLFLHHFVKKGNMDNRFSLEPA